MFIMQKNDLWVFLQNNPIILQIEVGGDNVEKWHPVIFYGVIISLYTGSVNSTQRTL